LTPGPTVTPSNTRTWTTTTSFLRALFTTKDGQTVSKSGLAAAEQHIQPGAYLELEGLDRVDELAGPSHPACDVEALADVTPATPANGAQDEWALVHVLVRCGQTQITVQAEIYAGDDEIIGALIQTAAVSLAGDRQK